MFKLKDSLLSIGLQLIAISVFAGDSLNFVSFNSSELLKLHNLWLFTENISGLSFNQIDKLTDFNLGISDQRGDFHLIREPNKSKQLYFNTSSYQSISNKFFVSGRFSYNNIDATGARWTGVFDPYRGNPYILADSLTGVETHAEKYVIGADLAFIKSNQIIIGCGFDYSVGVAAKQKDPRPEITVNSFKLNPSLIFTKKSYKFGINAGYSNRKEEVSYYTYKLSYKPTFFMFKGFGFYSTEIDNGFFRFQTENKGFCGIQVEKNFAGMNSMTELKSSYSIEKTEDGGSVIIREDGGDWKTWNMELNEKLKKEDLNTIRLFYGNLAFSNGNGIEYTQDVIYQGNNPKYITISKNLKFNRLLVNGDLGFDFFRMKDAARNNWSLKSMLSFRYNGEKYYYVPETFSSSFSNIAAFVSAQKNLYYRNFHFSATLSSSYLAGLSSNISLSELSSITNAQRKEIYQQEFDYNTSDLIGIKGILQFGYSPSTRKIGQFVFTFDQNWLKPVDGFYPDSYYNQSAKNTSTHAKVAHYKLITNLRIGLIF